MKLLKRLPKGIPMSPDGKGKALFFLGILMFGHEYFFPISRATKDLLGIRIVKGRMSMFFRKRMAIENFLRDILHSMYEQILGSIGSSIHRDLTDQIKDGFEKMFKDRIWDTVTGRLRKAAPKEITDGRGRARNTKKTGGD